MRKLLSAFCPAVRPVTGLTVRPSCKAPAQVCAGRLVIAPFGLFKQGTVGFPGSLTKAVTTLCCAALGSPVGKAVGDAAVGPAKIELSVKRETAFWASWRSPSKARNKWVLPFLIGAPKEPPN